ncbi:SGNH/GDSL hydrolase family protein [uncultured Tateyamaria sp.]|uniref:SGNH/GDSL hydrolase family protein n=2 Tax=uncultured Tateyamaria sp. TaxID=455651 RepID=UPI0026299025|nr:SGNH/GDSL hydrolase family protein [uncultured Tateyamaria sp.]
MAFNAFMTLLRTLAFALSAVLPAQISAQSSDFVSPSIVILGDSQIPFGSGPAFLEFFENIKSHCPPTPKQAANLEVLADMKVAVIGVRSTSLHSWTAKMGKAKGAICDVDPKWKVNAGTYGFINTTGNKYKQIGKGDAYQFCKMDMSAFQTMFRPGYYEPKLILLSFLGNSAKRWASSYDQAIKDVETMNAQLPAGVPCIFMTTAPSYSKKITDLRLKAQANVKRAFAETGSQCSFVEGATPETVAANQGNKTYFRLSKSGKVKDPYHPNEKAAKTFFMIAMDDICTAVYEQIEAAMPELAAR